MSKNRKYLIGLLLLIVIILIIWLMTHQAATPPSSNPPNPQPAVTLGHPTKTTHCEAAGSLPDRACTPGAVFETVTAKDICVSGYSSKVRNVPESEKRAVYAAYGIPSHKPGEYEVDHLISLELGGSNDISNLWPEAASPKPGFHQKDVVENYLHAQVCTGKLPLSAAQSQIAGNWLNVYFRSLPATG